MNCRSDEGDDGFEDRVIDVRERLDKTIPDRVLRKLGVYQVIRHTRNRTGAGKRESRCSLGQTIWGHQALGGTTLGGGDQVADPYEIATHVAIMRAICLSAGNLNFDC